MTTDTTLIPVTIEVDATDDMPANGIGLLCSYVPEASLRQIMKHATNIRRIRYLSEGVIVTIERPAEG